MSPLRPHPGVLRGGRDQPAAVALLLQGVGRHHLQQLPADPARMRLGQAVCRPCVLPMRCACVRVPALVGAMGVVPARTAVVL